MSSDPVTNAPTGVQDPPEGFSFGRSVFPVPNRNKDPKKDGLFFEYAEHCFIGDSITLTLANGEKVAASDHKLKLNDTLSLTYGQINGLGGDFYGTYDPISDGKDLQEQIERFVRAYNTLADGGPRLPKEAFDILKVLQAEVDAVNEALKHHQDPSTVYPKLEDVDKTLEWLTIGRDSKVPSYWKLAAINWDHFGGDAHTAYRAGHTIAIQRAVKGDLEGAYAMNAFADHFLEDSFSAGHLRTPRRLLHGTLPAADYCAKLMHDEDNAIGLSVKNQAGHAWTAYGDKRALDKLNEDNKKICVDAVQVSADEVYRAYQSKSAPSPNNYLALTLVPTLESAKSPTQALADLITPDNKRRKDLKKRRVRDYTSWWTYAGLIFDANWSGLWKYPITIDSLMLHIMRWTSVAASALPNGDRRQVFYQAPGSGILQSKYTNSVWSDGSEKDSLFKAAMFTPLAAVSFKHDIEAQDRVYYLDETYVLQEYCFTERPGGSWYSGTLGDLKIQVAPNTSIAAVQYRGEGESGPVSIRVYCQDPISRHIQEFCHDGKQWFKGAILPADALHGSRLAATAYVDNAAKAHIRVYYQSDDLSIKEYRYEGGEWVAGDLDGEKAPGWTPISAVGFAKHGGPYKAHVYWRNVKDEIVGTTSSDDGLNWGPLMTLEVAAQAATGSQLAALQWSNGDHLRIYYQRTDDSILEACKDDASWYEGGIVGKAHHKGDDEEEDVVEADVKEVDAGDEKTSN